MVVLTWAGKDAPPGRAALRLDDHMARRSLVCLDSGEMYNLGTTIVRVPLASPSLAPRASHSSLVRQSHTADPFQT